jgi:hypothetical protein
MPGRHSIVRFLRRRARNNQMSNLHRTAFVLALIIGTGSWFYLFKTFLPYAKGHEPPGMTWTNRSDLYPRWLGTRELIRNGQNPYSRKVTNEIQMGYYGRLADRGGFPNDEQRFAYPLFIIFFLAPTIALPFPIVNLGFGILLIALTVASVLLWIHALNLPFRRVTKLLCILFVLGSWPVAEGLHARQLTLLVAFLLSAAGAEMARGRLRAAGVCLACAMIKPQLVLLLVAWLLIWVSGKWRVRQSLIWSFLTTSGILLLGAELILPHWFYQWLTLLPSYVSYTGSKPSLERLFGSSPGRVLELILTAAVMWVFWRMRKAPARSESFGFALSLALSTTLVLLPTWSLASYNEVLLIPPVLWLCAGVKNVALSGEYILIYIIAALAVAWEPVAACALGIASLLPGFVASEGTLRIPVYLYFLVPIVVAAALLILGYRQMSHSDAQGF